MADDSDNKPIPEGRLPNGQIAPGHITNPEGKNQYSGPYQPYGLRVRKWIDMPRDDLVELANDKRAMGKLSVIDSICVRQLVASLAGKDAHKERESLLDRIEGKPKGTLELIGDKNAPLEVHTSSPTLEAATAAYLKALGK